MSTTVTRRITLDAGHRVPGHLGQCRNLHGHTYTIEATVEGDVPADGMVIDFGVLKDALIEEVHQSWDHAFLVHKLDTLARKALAVEPTWKVAVLDEPPTAENLAAEVACLIGPRLATAGVQLVRVVVHETPNCWACWEPAAAWP